MMYADKYDNHFLNIEARRSRFADFVRHTLNALLLPTTAPAVAALAPALQAALTAYQSSIVSRTTDSGDSQSGTLTEAAQWTAIKAFIKVTDVMLIQPAYFGAPADLKAIYPDKLSGLTQAPLAKRLDRFTAYTQALENRAGKLGAAPGKDARQLLVSYIQAVDSKQAAEGKVSATIAALGIEATTLCWAMWDVHCETLHAYRREPARAAAFFDYDLLPQNKRKPAAKPVAEAIL